MGDWYLGEIRLFSIAWNPEYWLPCDGRILQIQQYQALYSLLGTAFGGNGTTTFALPDLRGRTPVGTSTSNPSFQRGKAGGTETVPLTVTQIPAHIHTFQANSALGTANLISAGAAIASLNASAQLNPAPNVFAPPAGSNPSLIPLNPGTVSGGGSSAGHPNVQPSLTLNFCIATAGTYPPRN